MFREVTSSRLIIFNSARIRYRKAQLQAKRNADLAEEQERAEHIRALQAAAEALAKEREVVAEESQDHRSPTEMRTALFASRRPASRNTKQTQDDMVLNASSDLTSSLRRTHALLTDEVSRSRFAHETLEQSNAALTELNERYGALDDLLAKSRGLLGTLVRSQKSDTWYLQTTLYMLAATIAWLVFRRLFYGPLWWFVYLPFKVWYSMSWWVMSSIWGVAMTTKNNTIVLGTQEPLRVMPSASNRAPTFSKRAEQAYMPVGAGGAGAKQGLSSMASSIQSDTPMSDMVSKMVEASKAMADATPSIVGEMEAQMTAGSEAIVASDDQAPQGQQRQGDTGAAEAQPVAGVRRGDGEVLPERDEATQPRNPKKRMMEVPPELPMEHRDEL
jgi:protein transport protein SEC20